MASFFWYVLFFYDINYCNMHTYIFFFSFPALPLLPGSKSSDPIRILERIWIKISRGGFSTFFEAGRPEWYWLYLEESVAHAFFNILSSFFRAQSAPLPLAGNVETVFSFFSNSLLYIHIFCPSPGEGELSRNWCEFHRLYSITSL